MKNAIVLFFLFHTSILMAVGLPLDSIQKEIQSAESSGEYHIVANHLENVLGKPNISKEDKYNAYLLKAQVYKSLFRYDHAHYFLDQATAMILDNKNNFHQLQEIKAVRSFLYFDQQEFIKAADLMYQLEQTKYQTLDKKHVLYLQIQKGFFLIKERDYLQAESILTNALAVARDEFAAEMPIVYGKLIELYHLTKKTPQMLNSYKEGISIAKKYNNLKYEFYLEEVMKNLYSSISDYKNAFYHQKKCDSLYILYDANLKSSKLELDEISRKDALYKAKLKKNQTLMTLILILATILIGLLLLSLKLYISVKKNWRKIEEKNNRMR